MAHLALLTIIFYLGASSSYARLMDLGNTDSLRKNIADLLQGKLNFSDTNIPYFKKELTDTTPQNNDEYDFIVIGAGSAGATIASRLSEDNKIKVLLIEAGIKEYPIMDIPQMAGALQLSTQINWMYETESSDKYCLGLTNSSCKWPRGKVMGGSSVMNGMLMTRGNRKDYDDWAYLVGDVSWSFKNMLKYFKKLENFQVKELKINNKYHNKNGPLYIESAPYRTPFLTDAFIKANEELGLPLNDYSGSEQMGVSYAYLTTHNGERWSTNRAYLHSAKYRKNLFLTRNSHVNKILIDENTHTAYGVQFTKGDKNNIIVRTRREIILSAGAINSPQILMLSGIGPAKHLNDLGIRVIKDVPVGENLMDHISYIGLLFKVNDSATYTDVNILNPSDPTIETYLKERNGSLTIGGTEALSFVNVDNEELLSNDPNIEIIFSVTKGIADPIFSSIAGLSEEYKNKILVNNITQSTLAIWPMILNPKSRGKLLLRNKDPNAKPKIYANYLDHPEDVRILIGGIRTAIKLSKTKAFQKYGLELYDTPLPCDKFQFDSDAYWECACRTFTFSSYHYSGTCKMGKNTDKTAVVDSKLKVIGIKRLRVADASIMPKIPRAHTHIPVVAIAEKISDEIKKEWNICIE